MTNNAHRRAQILATVKRKRKQNFLWPRTHHNDRPKITTIANCSREKVGHSTRALRWLDWIFLGGYLPSLSINYVATSKDMGKRLPQLYYVKMKISFDLGFIAIGVAMAT